MQNISFNQEELCRVVSMACSAVRKRWDTNRHQLLQLYRAASRPARWCRKDAMTGCHKELTVQGASMSSHCPAACSTPCTAELARCMQLRSPMQNDGWAHLHRLARRHSRHLLLKQLIAL